MIHCLNNEAHFPHTFRGSEMQHIPVLSEHVDLLNSRNRLNIQLFQCALQLFVVLRGGWLCFPHDLSAHGPLSTWRG